VTEPGDLVARYGGEEFVVVIADVGPDEARARAERLRQSISREPFEVGADLPVHTAVSVGIACAPHHARTAGELVMAADQALYEAKQGGRDRVCVADS
jgi:diguanylate cyclase (GGDEF)-like protein